MKILVTGGAGKLGQWVVRALKAQQHDVTVFDRQPSGEPANREIIGDIEDLDAVTAAAAGAEAIIHLAGIPTHSVVPDNDTFRINAMGAFNIHEAARRNGVPRVVSLSSEAVLGWAPGSFEREHLPDYLPIDENHPCQPQDCYGLSKQVLESVGRAFSARCGMVTVFIRAPWVMSPDELETLRKNNGRMIKDFGLYHYIDARDLAEACRLAVEVELSGAQAVYVGSGETTVSVPLAELYPKLAPDIGDRAAALTGALAPVSNELARRLLGWSPKHSWRGDSSSSSAKPAARSKRIGQETP
ncbi:NAD-dependent epimerase/dehydratase family protein [Rhodoplanes sp. Z2-YC6860]|uniref:NAD-dependent epimerase/dehydratase family protein n=1 Tax=Rhodoplanes sp. Z2-YC6860 TaxID=674703 RepID=UPI00078D973F|nr:NAD(P)-dependent oxidoreductase [Rhodoplanes sp. Z2-YC6860]AMN45441.1 NAD-dependent epimerase/dehydratase [Rhodoplanes sp. Z2-YC6860]